MGINNSPRVGRKKFRAPLICIYYNTLYAFVILYIYIYVYDELEIVTFKFFLYFRQLFSKIRKSYVPILYKLYRYIKYIIYMK